MQGRNTTQHQQQVWGSFGAPILVLYFFGGGKMVPFNWVKWWKPWRRCKAVYPKMFRGQHVWGRCELDRGHTVATLHALERGMDIVTW